MNKSEKCSATQIGRMVIHKGEVERRVYPNELQKYLDSGWEIGIKPSHTKSMSIANIGKKSWNKGLTKNDHPSIMSAAKKLSELYKGSEPWNKGLTVSDDDRVKAMVEKSRNTKIEKYGSAFPNNAMTDEHKRKISESLKGKPNKYKGKKRSPEVGRKISEAKMGHLVSDETREKISNSKTGKKMDKNKLEIKLSKQYLTMKKNNSFNTSEPEKLLYETLLKENVNKTIYRQYKDSRYPFYCDFYIKEDDLFIELNAHWTHGGMPFDENNPKCIEQLNLWKEKAKTSKFYQAAIETWTVRDVMKFETAKKNNLNYKVIY